MTDDSETAIATASDSAEGAVAEFDPYYKWLAIPPKDQPPHHYRLLGTGLFESDPDVIDTAAEQRTTYLRTCATGEHVAHSQRLLNEVAAARLCLLNPRKKAEYDAQLKARLGPAAVSATRIPASRAAAVPEPDPLDGLDGIDDEDFESSRRALPAVARPKRRSPTRRGAEVAGIPFGVVVGGGVVALGAVLILGGFLAYRTFGGRAAGPGHETVADAGTVIEIDAGAGRPQAPIRPEGPGVEPSRPRAVPPQNDPSGSAPTSPDGTRTDPSSISGIPISVPTDPSQPVPPASDLPRNGVPADFVPTPQPPPQQQPQQPRTTAPGSGPTAPRMIRLPDGRMIMIPARPGTAGPPTGTTRTSKSYNGKPTPDFTLEEAERNRPENRPHAVQCRAGYIDRTGTEGTYVRYLPYAATPKRIPADVAVRQRETATWLLNNVDSEVIVADEEGAFHVRRSTIGTSNRQYPFRRGEFVVVYAEIDENRGAVPAQVLQELRHVRHLGMQRVRGDSADRLRIVAALPELRYLTLGFSEPPNDAALEAVARCRTLERIHLYPPGATPAALRHLASVQTLHWLSLQEATGCDDAVLESLATLPELAELHLRGVPATDLGLAALRGTRRLRSLTLNDMRSVRGEFLGEVASLPELAELEFFKVPVEDAGIARLAVSPRLERLKITEAPLTGAIWEPLSKIATLSRIEISNAPVGDEGFDALARIRALHRLRIVSCAVTPDAGQRLHALRPECEVHVTIR